MEPTDDEVFAMLKTALGRQKALQALQTTAQLTSCVLCSGGGVSSMAADAPRPDPAEQQPAQMRDPGLQNQKQFVKTYRNT
jgi:hypothetical protein